MLYTISVLWVAYAALAFGLRTLVQWRVTGAAGWNLFGSSKRPLERAAELLVAAALLGGFASACLQPTAAPFVHAGLGLGLYAAGTILTVAAQFAMGREWRVGVDANERTELVAHGLFGLVRNPIYSGMLLACAGLTLLCFTWTGCIAYGLLVLALELQVRLVEEPYLLRVHGLRYRHYAARVGRFVPRMGCFPAPSANHSATNPAT